MRGGKRGLAAWSRVEGCLPHAKYIIPSRKECVEERKGERQEEEGKVGNVDRFTRFHFVEKSDSIDLVE